MHNIEWIALGKATWETIYMVFISSFFSTVLGSILGIILFLTGKNKALENIWFHQGLALIINITRSVPFIILMISILPLTRILVGTTIGINAAIVPLTIAAIPFYARICESAFSEVPTGLLETADTLGATTWQTVLKVLIPESLPALIRGITLTVIGLIGYSAMSGAVGGGGLGELAINYGYQRFDLKVMTATVIVLIILVQLVQWSGDWLAKKRTIFPLILLSIFLGIACIISQSDTWVVKPQNELRVGVMSGWSQEVMATAQKVALKNYNLNLKIIVFDDYVLPNTALANGNIDANIFQHVPYLNAQIQEHGYQLIPIAKTFVYPMGFYSQKITHINQLSQGAIVAIPNDPSNEARALLLLQKSGLITLKKNVSTLATVNDILVNPKSLQFKLLDAAQLPRVLPDAELVAITNDYIQAAGLNIRQALIKEGADSLYANVIVIRAVDKNNPNIEKLVTVMHSQQVLQITKKLFPNGAAIPAW